MNWFKQLKHFPLRYWTRLMKEFLLFFPLAILLLILTNLFHPETAFDKTKIRLLQNSADLPAHLSLIDFFISNHQYFAAQQELSSLKNFSNNDEVKKRLAEVYNSENEPALVQQQIIRWQNLLDLYPAYRDADLKLAILNWKLYRSFDVTKFLGLAKQLDPNNEFIKKLSVTLK